VASGRLSDRTVLHLAGIQPGTFNEACIQKRLSGPIITYHNMPSPSFVFGFVLATLYGSAFHFISGGDARRLALFLLASWIGFALGHITGDLLVVEVFDVGPINALNATVGAVIALIVARILTRQPT